MEPNEHVVAAVYVKLHYRDTHKVITIHVMYDVLLSDLLDYIAALSYLTSVATELKFVNGREIVDIFTEK